jgi:hypothetical protein
MFLYYIFTTKKYGLFIIVYLYIYNSYFIPHMLHGAGLFTNIYRKKWPSHVGKYSSTMEHIGTII